MGSPLVWIRNKWSKLFYHFGIHCATHQIRLILISGLVITSLFYPALGIYKSSYSKFFPTSTHILAHIDLLSLTFYHDDLESVWSGHDALRIAQDQVSRASCGIEKTLRVERVLLTTNGFESERGAITRELLSSVLELQNAMDAHAQAVGLKCLQSPSGRCLFLSPMEFWSHNEQALLTDPELLRTINTAMNTSASGLPLKASMVFAGRESTESHDGAFDFAAYLALTYFFHEDDCDRSSGHDSWLTALDDITSSRGVVSVKAKEPVFLTLTFDPEMKSVKHISLITSTLYLSYIIFFIYFSGSMRRMDTVHSRIGLCFTGLVEILVSTITSLSVCTLYGLRLTLIPWGIFPIVIVFVGAENMFRLIDEVVKTPVSLPVKERIGLGLGRAGTSNTLKVCSYNAILGVIAFFAQGAIRQFCTFAIVVLVAHWFLIHTFFVAVLSIDIQRLELDDLLRQNPSLAPTKSMKIKSPLAAGKVNTNVFSRMKMTIRHITKGRVTKNVSLLLMLVIAATLYYSTLPPAHKEHINTAASRTMRFRSGLDQSRLASYSEARSIWRILSPEDDPRIHMMIEAPAIVTLDHHLEDMKGKERPLHPRWSMRTFRHLWWIVKVMVVPIGATLLCLYGLLLYLLKGTERLENSRERSSRSEDQSLPIEGQPRLITYPRTCATDIALFASDLTGDTLLSVSFDGDFTVWLQLQKQFIEIDTSVLSTPDTSGTSTAPYITAIAVEHRGMLFAAGTADGVIVLWSINGVSVNYTSRLISALCTCPIKELHVAVGASQLFSGEFPQQFSSAPTVLASCDGGHVARWCGDVFESVHPFEPGIVTRAKLLKLESTAFPLACFIFDDGGLEVVDITQSSITKGTFYILAGSSVDNVSDVDMARVPVDDAPHLLLCVARHSGGIGIWDMTEGDCVASIDDANGTVDGLRIFPVPPRACPQCGEIPQCSFCLVHSVGHLVFVDRGNLSRRCSCPVTQTLVFKTGPAREPPFSRHSRSSSFAGPGMDAALRTRSRKSSFTSDPVPITSPFPVSGHGMHAKRGSERETRRTNGNSSVDHGSVSSHEDINLTDSIDHQRLLVPDTMAFPRQSPEKSETSSDWRNLRLLRIAEATCERGGWGVSRSTLIGLCRKPRNRNTKDAERLTKQALASDSSALSSSVLDRWQMWMIDPRKNNDTINSSTLADIEQVTWRHSLARSQFPKLSFTRLSPIVFRRAFVVTGFGNTIGMIDLRSSLRND